MTKNKKFILAVVFLLILVPLGIAAKRVWLNPPLTVRVTKTIVKDLRQTISSSGTVEAREKVQVAFETAGRVKAVYFKEQDKVKKGQVLARLVDDEILAQLEQARTTVLQAEINLRNMEKHLKRAQELYKKGFISLEGMETAQVEYDMASEILAQRKASYEGVKARSNSSVITAPISGTIIRKFIKEGEIVAGPLSASRISEPIPIAEIADLDEMEVSTDIDETEVKNIHEGQQTLIKIDAYPDKILKGTVRGVAMASSSERREAGRNYRVNVTLMTSPDWLRLGMTATVDFIVQEKEGVLCVPVDIVLQRENRAVVFINAAGKIKEQEVKTGIGDDEYVEITKGLKEGEEVITGDLSKLKPGEKVTLVR